jgi:flavodoxin
MKALIVYDSVYGNTEQVAKAVAGAIAGEVRVLRAGEASASDLTSIDLLIVGAPTQGGRATPPVQAFLGKIPADALKNVGVTAFDTRVKNFVARLFGYPAGRIADSLKSKGGYLAAPPEGFIVKGTKGPLVQGEMERAAAWAKGVAIRKAA